MCYFCFLISWLCILFAQSYLALRAYSLICVHFCLWTCLLRGHVCLCVCYLTLLSMSYSSQSCPLIYVCHSALPCLFSVCALISFALSVCILFSFAMSGHASLDYSALLCLFVSVCLCYSALQSCSLICICV